MTINFIIKKEEHATRSIRVAIGPHRRLDEYISAVIETEDVVLHEKASFLESSESSETSAPYKKVPNVILQYGCP